MTTRPFPRMARFGPYDARNRLRRLLANLAREGPVTPKGGVFSNLVEETTRV